MCTNRTCCSYLIQKKLRTLTTSQLEKGYTLQSTIEQIDRTCCEKQIQLLIKHVRKKMDICRKNDKNLPKLPSSALNSENVAETFDKQILIQNVVTNVELKEVLESFCYFCKEPDRFRSHTSHISTMLFSGDNDMSFKTEYSVSRNEISETKITDNEEGEGYFTNSIGSVHSNNLKVCEQDLKKAGTRQNKSIKSSAQVKTILHLSPLSVKNVVSYNNSPFTKSIAECDMTINCDSARSSDCGNRNSCLLRKTSLINNERSELKPKTKPLVCENGGTRNSSRQPYDRIQSTLRLTQKSGLMSLDSIDQSEDIQNWKDRYSEYYGGSNYSENKMLLKQEIERKGVNVLNESEENQSSKIKRQAYFRKTSKLMIENVNHVGHLETEQNEAVKSSRKPKFWQGMVNYFHKQREIAVWTARTVGSGSSTDAQGNSQGSRNTSTDPVLSQISNPDIMDLNIRYSNVPVQNSGINAQDNDGTDTFTKDNASFGNNPTSLATTDTSQRSVRSFHIPSFGDPLSFDIDDDQSNECDYPFLNTVETNQSSQSETAEDVISENSSPRSEKTDNQVETSSCFNVNEIEPSDKFILAKSYLEDIGRPTENRGQNNILRGESKTDKEAKKNSVEESKNSATDKVDETDSIAKIQNAENKKLNSVEMKVGLETNIIDPNSQLGTASDKRSEVSTLVVETESSKIRDSLETSICGISSGKNFVDINSDKQLTGGDQHGVNYLNESSAKLLPGKHQDEIKSPHRKEIVKGQSSNASKKSNEQIQSKDLTDTYKNKKRHIYSLLDFLKSKPNNTLVKGNTKKNRNIRNRVPETQDIEDSESDSDNRLMIDFTNKSDNINQLPTCDKDDDFDLQNEGKNTNISFNASTDCQDSFPKRRCSESQVIPVVACGDLNKQNELNSQVKRYSSHPGTSVSYDHNAGTRKPEKSGDSLENSVGEKISPYKDHSYISNETTSVSNNESMKVQALNLEKLTGPSADGKRIVNRDFLSEKQKRDIFDSYMQAGIDEACKSHKIPIEKLREVLKESFESKLNEVKSLIEAKPEVDTVKEPKDSQSVSSIEPQQYLSEIIKGNNCNVNQLKDFEKDETINLAFRSDDKETLKAVSDKELIGQANVKQPVDTKDTSELEHFTVRGEDFVTDKLGRRLYSYDFKRRLLALAAKYGDGTVASQLGFDRKTIAKWRFSSAKLIENKNSSKMEEDKEDIKIKRFRYSENLKIKLAHLAKRHGVTNVVNQYGVKKSSLNVWIQTFGDRKLPSYYLTDQDLLELVERSEYAEKLSKVALNRKSKIKAKKDSCSDQVKDQISCQPETLDAEKKKRDHSSDLFDQVIKSASQPSLSESIVQEAECIDKPSLFDKLPDQQESEKSFTENTFPGSIPVILEEPNKEGTVEQREIPPKVASLLRTAYAKVPHELQKGSQPTSAFIHGNSVVFKYDRPKTTADTAVIKPSVTEQSHLHKQNVQLTSETGKVLNTVHVQVVAKTSPENVVAMKSCPPSVIHVKKSEPSVIVAPNISSAASDFSRVPKATPMNVLPVVALPAPPALHKYGRISPEIRQQTTSCPELIDYGTTFTKSSVVDSTAESCEPPLIRTPILRPMVPETRAHPVRIDDSLLLSRSTVATEGTACSRSPYMQSILVRPVATESRVKSTAGLGREDYSTSLATTCTKPHIAIVNSDQSETPFVNTSLMRPIITESQTQPLAPPIMTNGTSIFVRKSLLQQVSNGTRPQSNVCSVTVAKSTVMAVEPVISGNNSNTPAVKFMTLSNRDSEKYTSFNTASPITTPQIKQEPQTDHLYEKAFAISQSTSISSTQNAQPQGRSFHIPKPTTQMNLLASSSADKNQSSVSNTISTPAAVSDSHPTVFVFNESGRINNISQINQAENFSQQNAGYAVNSISSGITTTTATIVHTVPQITISSTVHATPKATVSTTSSLNDALSAELTRFWKETPPIILKHNAKKNLTNRVTEKSDVESNSGKPGHISPRNDYLSEYKKKYGIENVPQVMPLSENNYLSEYKKKYGIENVPQVMPLSENKSDTETCSDSKSSQNDMQIETVDNKKPNDAKNSNPFPNALTQSEIDDDLLYQLQLLEQFKRTKKPNTVKSQETKQEHEKPSATSSRLFSLIKDVFGRVKKNDFGSKSVLQEDSENPDKLQIKSDENESGCTKTAKDSVIRKNNFRFSHSLKVKLAAKAIREKTSVASLSKRYNISEKCLHRWRSLFSETHIIDTNLTKKELEEIKAHRIWLAERKVLAKLKTDQSKEFQIYIDNPESPSVSEPIGDTGDLERRISMDAQQTKLDTSLKETTGCKFTDRAHSELCSEDTESCNEDTSFEIGDCSEMKQSYNNDSLQVTAYDISRQISERDDDNSQTKIPRKNTARKSTTQGKVFSKLSKSDYSSFERPTPLDYQSDVEDSKMKSKEQSRVPSPVFDVPLYIDAQDPEISNKEREDIRKSWSCLFANKNKVKGIFKTTVNVDNAKSSTHLSTINVDSSSEDSGGQNMNLKNSDSSEGANGDKFQETRKQFIDLKENASQSNLLIELLKKPKKIMDSQFSEGSEMEKLYPIAGDTNHSLQFKLSVIKEAQIAGYENAAKWYRLAPATVRQWLAAFEGDSHLAFRLSVVKCAKAYGVKHASRLFSIEQHKIVSWLHEDISNANSSDENQRNSEDKTKANKREGLQFDSVKNGEVTILRPKFDTVGSCSRAASPSEIEITSNNRTRTRMGGNSVNFTSKQNFSKAREVAVCSSNKVLEKEYLADIEGDIGAMPRIVKQRSFRSSKNESELEIASTWKQVQEYVQQPIKSKEKKYSPDFKSRIIKLCVQKGQKVVAKEHKIPYNKISRWRLKAKNAGMEPDIVDKIKPTDPQLVIKINLKDEPKVMSPSSQREEVQNSDYSEEFKKEVVSYSRKHGFIAAAREYKIGNPRILSWIRQFRSYSFESDHNTVTVSESSPIKESHKIKAKKIKSPRHSNTTSVEVFQSPKNYKSGQKSPINLESIHQDYIIRKPIGKDSALKITLSPRRKSPAPSRASSDEGSEIDDFEEVAAWNADTEEVDKSEGNNVIELSDDDEEEDVIIMSETHLKSKSQSQASDECIVINDEDDKEALKESDLQSREQNECQSKEQNSKTEDKKPAQSADTVCDDLLSGSVDKEVCNPNTLLSESPSNIKHVSGNLYDLLEKAEDLVTTEEVYTNDQDKNNKHSVGENGHEKEKDKNQDSAVEEDNEKDKDSFMEIDNEEILNINKQTNIESTHTDATEKSESETEKAKVANKELTVVLHDCKAIVNENVITASSECQDNEIDSIPYEETLTYKVLSSEMDKFFTGAFEVSKPISEISENTDNSVKPKPIVKKRKMTADVEIMENLDEHLRQYLFGPQLMPDEDEFIHEGYHEEQETEEIDEIGLEEVNQTTVVKEDDVANKPDSEEAKCDSGKNGHGENISEVNLAEQKEDDKELAQGENNSSDQINVSNEDQQTNDVIFVQEQKESINFNKELEEDKISSAKNVPLIESDKIDGSTSVLQVDIDKQIIKSEPEEKPSRGLFADLFSSFSVPTDTVLKVEETPEMEDDTIKNTQNRNLFDIIKPSASGNSTSDSLGDHPDVKKGIVLQSENKLASKEDSGSKSEKGTESENTRASPFRFIGSLMKNIKLPAALTLKSLGGENVLEKPDLSGRQTKVSANEESNTDSVLMDKKEETKGERNLFDFLSPDSNIVDTPKSCSSTSLSSPVPSLFENLKSKQPADNPELKKQTDDTTQSSQPSKPKPGFKFLSINFGQIAKLGMAKLKENNPQTHEADQIPEVGNIQLKIDSLDTDTQKDKQEEINTKAVALKDNAGEGKKITDSDISGDQMYINEGKTDDAPNEKILTEQKSVDTSDDNGSAEDAPGIRSSEDEKVDDLEGESNVGTKSDAPDGESDAGMKLDGSNQVNSTSVKKIRENDEALETADGDEDDDELYKSFAPQKVILILDISKKHGIEFASTSFGLPPRVIVNWIIEKDRKHRKVVSYYTLEEKLNALKQCLDIKLEDVCATFKISVDTILSWKRELDWLLKSPGVIDVLQKWSKIQPETSLSLDDGKVLSEVTAGENKGMERMDSVDGDYNPVDSCNRKAVPLEELPDILNFAKTTHPKDFSLEQKAIIVLLLDKYGVTEVNKKLGISTKTLWGWKHRAKSAREYILADARQRKRKLSQCMEETNSEKGVANPSISLVPVDSVAKFTPESSKLKSNLAPRIETISSVSQSKDKLEPLNKIPLAPVGKSPLKGYRLISPTKIPDILKDVRKLQTKDISLEQRVAIVKLVDLYGVRTIHKQFRIPAGSIWNWQHSKTVMDLARPDGAEGKVKKNIDFDESDFPRTKPDTIEIIMERVKNNLKNLNHLRFNLHQKADAVCLVNYHGVDSVVKDLQIIPRGTLWNWCHNKYVSRIVEKKMQLLQETESSMKTPEKNNSKLSEDHKSTVSLAENLKFSIDKKDLTQKWLSLCHSGDKKRKVSGNSVADSEVVLDKKMGEELDLEFGNMSDNSECSEHSDHHLYEEIDLDLEESFNSMSERLTRSSSGTKMNATPSLVSSVSIHSGDFDEITSDDETSRSSKSRMTGSGEKRRVRHQWSRQNKKRRSGTSDVVSEVDKLEDEIIEVPVYEVMDFKTAKDNRMMVSYKVTGAKSVNLLTGEEGKFSKPAFLHVNKNHFPIQIQPNFNCYEIGLFEPLRIIPFCKGNP